MDDHSKYLINLSNNQHVSKQIRHKKPTMRTHRRKSDLYLDLSLCSRHSWPVKKAVIKSRIFRKTHRNSGIYEAEDGRIQAKFRKRVSLAEETYRYQQLEQWLLQGIIDGRWKPGDRLPSIREICTQRSLSILIYASAMSPKILAGISSIRLSITASRIVSFVTANCLGLQSSRNTLPGSESKSFCK